MLLPFRGPVTFLFLRIFIIQQAIGFPTPPPLVQAAQWLHDYQETAHGLVDAVQHSQFKHHSEYELAPLPPSLPRIISDDPVVPLQTSGPQEWIHTSNAESSQIHQHVSDGGIEPEAVSLDHDLDAVAGTSDERRFSPSSPNHAHASTVIAKVPIMTSQSHAVSEVWPEPSSAGRRIKLRLSETSIRQLQESHTAWHPALKDAPDTSQQSSLAYDLFTSVPTHQVDRHSLTPQGLQPSPSPFSSLPLENQQHRASEPQQHPQEALSLFHRNLYSTFSRVIIFPKTYGWSPSPQLMQELTFLFRRRYRVQEQEVYDLGEPSFVNARAFAFEVQKLFQPRTNVFALWLPSSPVLVKFHVRELPNGKKYSQGKVSVWSLQNDAYEAPVLMLRGLIGVPSGLYGKLRRQGGKATYLVTHSEDQGKVLRLESEA